MFPSDCHDVYSVADISQLANGPCGNVDALCRFAVGSGALQFFEQSGRDLNTRYVGVQPHAHLCRLERNDSGEKRKVSEFGRVEKPGQRVGVVNGLGLKELRAGVDFATRIFNLAREILRSRVDRGTEK